MKKYLLLLMITSSIVIICYSLYIYFVDNQEIVQKEYYTVFTANYDITYDDLIKEGFSQIPAVDNNVVEKSNQMNDTLITQYNVDHYYKLIFQKVSFIKFDTFNIDSLENFIESNGAHIITNVCLNKRNMYNFFAENNDNYLLFHCYYYFDEYEKKYLLRVVHNYPANYKIGDYKNHPFYEFLEKMPEE